MRIGSLCTGVGGLELGLEWAGLGETVFQVEIDPFCRRILGKHWPNAKQFEDLREVGKHNLPNVDLICFGFPCQDVSSAGAKTGLSGARSGLFYQCARIVAELAPEWVVVENVASGAKLWVDSVLAELGRLGYACLPLPLSASHVGALHQRARVFVVAHTDRGLEHAEPGFSEVASASATIRAARVDGFPGWGPEPELVRMADGLPKGLDIARGGAHRLAAIRTANDLAADRERALSNAVVPQCAEVIGWVIRTLIEK